MKKAPRSPSALVLLLLGFSSATPLQSGLALAQPQGPNPQPRIEDATPIKLRLQRTISSADAQVDDRVDFDVLEEIKVGELTVIPKGSVAWGTVTLAQPKRRMGKGGKLNVNIDAVRLADGEKAPLRAVKEAKGGGHGGAMAGGMIATGIVFFPAAPLFLLMHGKDITIPKGTEITAYINGDFPIDTSKFGAPGTARAESTGGGQTTDSLPQPASQAAAPSPLAAQPGAAAQPPEPATIAIKSTPEGADVTVDGKFVGNTPATLKLTPGDHTFTIGMSGFKTWQRTMTTSAGASLTLNATLEKAP